MLLNLPFGHYHASKIVGFQRILDNFELDDFTCERFERRNRRENNLEKVEARGGRKPVACKPRDNFEE